MLHSNLAATGANIQPSRHSFRPPAPAPISELVPVRVSDKEEKAEDIMSETDSGEESTGELRIRSVETFSEIEEDKDELDDSDEDIKQGAGSTKQATEENEKMGEENTTDNHSLRPLPKPLRGLNFDEDLKTSLSGELELVRQPSFFERLQSTPNPCLNIDGLGSIGVPLSLGDAKAIANLAEHSETSESGNSGGNSWSISAAQISFNNPHWTEFVQQTVAERVWNGLALDPEFASARCTLEELTLFGPGSLNLLRRCETANEPSISIMVQLPSFHAGGQVIVSHPTQSHARDIDLAKDPFLASILASYTSVDLSFTPITEGYRLVLVYRLISTCPDIKLELSAEPLMTLQLRHTFQTWLNGDYDSAPARRHFAYVIEHQRPSLRRARLREHAPLTSKEQGMFSCLQTIAKEFGYIVYSGRLKYHDVHDNSSDYGSEYDDYCLEPPEETYPTFERMVGPDGIAMSGVEVELRDNDIFPLNFLINHPPSSTSGYDCGTVGCSFDALCRRALLVIPQEKEKDIIGKAKHKYWLSKLELLDPNGPDSLDSEKIDLILSRISDWEKDSISRLIKLALKWKDPELWFKAIQKLDKAVGKHAIEVFVEAWNVFSFLRMKPIFDTILLNTPSTNDRLKFVKKLEAHAPEQDRETVEAWVTEQYTKILEARDVDAIVQVGRERGAKFLSQILTPHLAAHPPEIEFILNLYLKLRSNASTIPDSVPSPPPGEESEITARKLGAKYVRKALNRKKYKIYGVSSPQMLSAHDRPVFSHLKTVIRLSLTLGRVQECNIPLRMLLHVDAGHYKDLVETYKQLVTDFRGWLAQKKLSIATTPFKHFFASVVGLHMQYILNSPRPNFNDHIPTFGCGRCEYCGRIDRFLRNPVQTVFQEQILAAQKRHVEPYLANYSLAQYSLDLARGCKTKTVLTLNKNEKLRALQVWESKINSAKTYLSTIGTDAEIAELMEDEYPKIQESMKGTRPYMASQRFKEALGEITEETLELSNSAGKKKRKSVAVDEEPSKRARAEQPLDNEVIDLTSNP